MNTSLENAIKIFKNSKWKIDILETIWFELKTDYENEPKYKEKIDNLPNWNYFISDLDGTFFRWTLIQEAFSLFIKYIRLEKLQKLDLNIYKHFLDDYVLFKELENDAYNKKINFWDYLNAGLVIIYKYHNLISWDNYLLYLKDSFYMKEKVNPYRFSFSKIKEILLQWDNFMFVSWASRFVFDIYLDLLKNYIWKNIWEKYTKQIFWFSSYENLKEQYVYNLWNHKSKYEFIEILKNTGKIKKILWGMWDTTSDFGIANHLEVGNDFYFMNPAYSVLDNLEELWKKWVNVHLISERKDIIYEFKKESIQILN